MFKNYGEKKFKKQFPELKQVINDVPVDFEMYGQVPLQNGENSVYLLEPNGKKSTYTMFDVDVYHKYGLRIELNYPYVIKKIQKQLIIAIIFGVIISLLVQVLLSGLGIWALLISFLVLVAIYYFTANKLVADLGISAYKVVVVKTPIN